MTGPIDFFTPSEPWEREPREVSQAPPGAIEMGRTSRALLSPLRGSPRSRADWTHSSAPWATFFRCCRSLECRIGLNLAPVGEWGVPQMWDRARRSLP